MKLQVFSYYDRLFAICQVANTKLFFGSAAFAHCKNFWVRTTQKNVVKDDPKILGTDAPNPNFLTQKIWVAATQKIWVDATQTIWVAATQTI